MGTVRMCIWFFFFNDTATTEIYTLSLHDALPICGVKPQLQRMKAADRRLLPEGRMAGPMPWVLAIMIDRKSTRLNSSHANISYAVFCLKKKKIHPSLVISISLSLISVLLFLHYLI